MLEDSRLKYSGRCMRCLNSSPAPPACGKLCRQTSHEGLRESRPQLLLVLPSLSGPCLTLCQHLRASSSSMVTEASRSPACAAFHRHGTEGPRIRHRPWGLRDLPETPHSPPCSNRPFLTWGRRWTRPWHWGRAEYGRHLPSAAVASSYQRLLEKDNVVRPIGRPQSRLCFLERPQRRYGHRLAAPRSARGATQVRLRHDGSHLWYHPPPHPPRHRQQPLAQLMQLHS